MTKHTKAVIVASLVALAVSLALGLAEADVVTGPPPEDDCPDGSRGTNCAGYGHGNDTCVPRTCESDRACDEGERCEEVELCLSRVECGYGEEGIFEDNVLGSCEEGCSGDSTCEARQVCLTAPVFDSVGGGCSCALAAPRRSPLPPLLGL